MKALVCEAYGPVDNLVYREFPDPVPADNEVLVDVEAIGNLKKRLRNTLTNSK